MTRWLNIIGVTEEGTSALSPVVALLLRDAKTLLGPERLMPQTPRSGQTIQLWEPPLENMIGQVISLRGTPTAILATGDPNWFGIGATLMRHLSPEEFAIHPAPSSFQLAAARLHWPLQQVETISLHGRDVAGLIPHLFDGARILALTSDRKTLTGVGSLLEQHGFARSRLYVLEDLGGPGERRRETVATEASQFRTGDFYVLAIEAVADPGLHPLPLIGGLSDEAFVNDGQLTKRDVRAATLAKLAPVPGALLWDVGAGCGSVAIEWMRAARGARAIAFEKNPERCAMIETNRIKMGTPGLNMVTGEAPASLAGAESPDAIFIGGDVANPDLFDACWQVLKLRGRLVANAVTLDAEAALFERQSRYGGELTRIEISVLDTIGKERVLRPRLPVTQWAVTKTETGGAA